MRKCRYAGRRLLFWGSLSLMIWAGYEAWVRMDMLRWVFGGLYNLCTHENIPFTRAIWYFDTGMFVLVLFLIACALFGLLAFSLRNKPRSGYLLAVGAVALAACGLGPLQLMTLRFDMFSWMQAAKLLPMLMIVAGCVVNLAQYHVAEHRRRAEARAEKDGERMDREEESRSRSRSVPRVTHAQRRPAAF